MDDLSNAGPANFAACIRILASCSSGAGLNCCAIRTSSSIWPIPAEKIRTEAGCRTVIGSRLKKSGMFWTVRGANAILALRCCHLNGRFEDYWEARRAA